LSDLKILLSKVRVVNFATSKDLIVKSTMFPHRNIHKYTWTCTDGNNHSQIHHILIDRRRHSSVLDVRSFRAADCDTNHCLLVAKIKERLAVNKQEQHKFHMQRFNLKNLNEVEGTEKYPLEVQIRLQLWKIWAVSWKLIVLGKRLEGF
jgi:hypothetical protein